MRRPSPLTGVALVAALGALGPAASHALAQPRPIPAPPREPADSPALRARAALDKARDTLATLRGDTSGRRDAAIQLLRVASTEAAALAGTSESSASIVAHAPNGEPPQEALLALGMIQVARTQLARVPPDAAGRRAKALAATHHAMLAVRVLAFGKKAADGFR
jgi:hypothetical protein